MPFENDNTKVTIKEKQFPIKREFNYTTPVVTQGRTISKTEKEASDKKTKIARTNTERIERLTARLRDHFCCIRLHFSILLDKS